MAKFWKKELSNISELAIIGRDCIIHSHVIIYDDVIVGHRNKIQAFVFIPNGVRTGDDVFIGPNVTFTNDKHPPSNGAAWEKTYIHSKAIIGAGSVILPGVIIGVGACVGAGSVVTKDIPSGETWCGNPARRMK